jgi:hypothetical protein
MPLTISRTTAFRRLQSRIGFSTYRLNTIFIGLQHIAQGGGQQEEAAVAIGWNKPKLERAKETADQARIFACSGALVLGADVLDSFLREFARQEWLGIPEDVRDMATRAKTRKREQGGDYSVAERAEALASEFGLHDATRIAAIDLFTRWRNVVTHTSERTVRGFENTRATLLLAKQDIGRDYRNLDIELALQNFDARKVPLAKEVTTLTAIAVNFSRALDEAAIRRAAGSSESIVLAADAILRAYFRSSDNRTVSPWAEVSTLGHGGKRRRMNLLKKILSQAGITEGQKAISASLPPSYLDELLELTRDKLAERLGVRRPNRSSR